MFPILKLSLVTLLGLAADGPVNTMQAAQALPTTALEQAHVKSSAAAAMPALPLPPLGYRFAGRHDTYAAARAQMAFLISQGYRAMCHRHFHANGRWVYHVFYRDTVVV